MELKVMRESLVACRHDILIDRLKDHDMQQRFRTYIDERVCVSHRYSVATLMGRSINTTKPLRLLDTLPLNLVVRKR